MKKIILFLLVCPLILNAQYTPNQIADIDSIKLVIKTAKHDSIIIKSWLAWDDIIYVSDPTLDVKLNEKIDSLCSINLSQSLPKKDRIFFQNAKAYSLNILGTNSNTQGDYKKCFDYHQEALELYKITGNKEGEIKVYGNIGLLYAKQNDHKRAIEHFFKCLKFQQKYGSERVVAQGYINIGNSYEALGILDKAMYYCTEAKKIFHKIGDEQNYAEALRTIGNIYYRKDDLEKAHQLYLESLTITEKIGETLGEIRSLIGLARYFNAKNQHSTCINRATKALIMAQEIGLYNEEMNASFWLWDSKKKLGLYKEALIMHEIYMVAKDSVNNESNRKEIISQQFKTSYEKKVAMDSLLYLEQKNLSDLKHKKETEKQKIMIGATTGGLILVIGFLFFVFNRLRVTKRQKKIIEVQKVEVELQKERSEELLLNILPYEIAEELKEKGSADSQLIDLVTVLFTDFKGFTSLSEVLSPENLVKEINVCFSAFDHIMVKHNIEKIKTIGDAYMAAGGLPTVNETHAVDVVNAAIEIQQFMINHAAEKKANSEPFFEIRIGVHTGPVIAGIVGVKKFQYDIWGDTVNTASRMESSGAVGMVNVSETTYHQIKNVEGLNFESRGKIEAKGKGLLEMYFVHKIPSA